MGVSFVELQDWDKAKDIWRQALQIQPEAKYIRHSLEILEREKEKETETPDD
jgi:hypothetical protein